MELFWVVANLLIFLFNCFLFMTFVLLKLLGEKKHKNKKYDIVGVAMLVMALLFDFVCIVTFVVKEQVENCAIFVLFIPLMGYFLYEEIKDIKKV